jgi:hypothetical protein
MDESSGQIEPCLFESDVPAALTDLAVEIQAEAAGIGRNLNEDSLAELADLVRLMNSYYSNLIEGHKTRPRDIERALAGQQIEEDKRPLAKPRLMSTSSEPSTLLIAPASCPSPCRRNSSHGRTSAFTTRCRRNSDSSIGRTAFGSRSSRANSDRSQTMM